MAIFFLIVANFANLKNSPKNRGRSYERQTRDLGTVLGGYHRVKSEAPISTRFGVIRGRILKFDPHTDFENSYLRSYGDPGELTPN